jgi:hypothetical protein
MDLPRIKNADYPSYMKNWIVQAIFSDLWGGSYKLGRDVLFGGAPSVDIASAQWTPVNAAGDGKVIFAWELKGYGNSITIEHTIKGDKKKWIKERKIWTSYSHLDKIFVKKWDYVKELKIIWEIGKTGFTIGMFGNHLDFAITTTKQKYYPYSYNDCKAWYMSAVQDGSCRDLMQKNTIDPIAFIEMGGNLDKSIKLAKAVVDQSKLEKKILAENKSDQKSTASKALDTAKLAVINEKIYSVRKDNLTIEIVDLKSEKNEALPYKGKAYVTVVIKDKNGKPYNGFLKKELTFTSKSNAVTIDWGKIDYIKGERTVILRGTKQGDDTISVMLWWELIGIHNTKVSL